MPGPGSVRQTHATSRPACSAWLLALCALPVLLLTPGCAPSPPATSNVTVLAASSLADALPALIEPLSQQGLDVKLVFAASSTLARQAEAGAPFDVFFCADERWLDDLVDGGLIDASSAARPLGNQLVVIRPGASGDAPGVAGPAQAVIADALNAMADDQRIVLGDPAHVPAGRYARAALEHLNLWTDVEPRAVLADNVRAALALVARGEAALGVVYRTDLALAPAVSVVSALPAAPSQPVRYGLGRAAGLDDAQRARAQRVMSALTDAGARAHYATLGFEPL